MCDEEKKYVSLLSAPLHHTGLEQAQYIEGFNKIKLWLKDKATNISVTKIRFFSK